MVAGAPGKNSLILIIFLIIILLHNNHKYTNLLGIDRIWILKLDTQPTWARLIPARSRPWLFTHYEGLYLMYQACARQQCAWLPLVGEELFEVPDGPVSYLHVILLAFF